MRVLSLFDGIPCGRVALDRAGLPVDAYHAYEINGPALQISQKNWPAIIQHGDVTVADFTKFRGFELLMGGSPCQSLSIVQSKTRQHLDGKSKLFFEFVRAKEETRPRWFLFENVASMNTESKLAISELLKVLQNGRARKLTPLEYERLQTLPDNYTAGVADGHRYTAIGNGWTVAVIAWILSHIPKEEDAWML